MTIQQQSPPSARTSAWHERSRCQDLDPDLFFPIGDSVAAQRQAEEAKGVCRRCEVWQPCLAWALEHCSEGVWGATDEGERQTLRLSCRG